MLFAFWSKPLRAHTHTKASLLNDFFKSAFTVDNGILPYFPSRLTSPDITISDLHITPNVIKLILRKLKINSAAGPDGLPSGVPRVSGARGENENWRPLPPACRTGKRRRRSPLLLDGGLGRSPNRQRFLEYLGVNGTHFWIAFNTIFNSTRRTDKRRKRFPLLLGKRGLGRSPSRQRYWEHLGVNGTHFWIALTPFSTLRACKTGKRRRRSPSLLGGLQGGTPAANAFGRI